MLYLHKTANLFFVNDLPTPAESNTQPRNSSGPVILIDHANIIFLGHLNAGTEHRHAAAVCLVGLDKPFNLRFENTGEAISSHSAIVPADKTHWLDPEGGLTAVIYSEIYSPRYELMKPGGLDRPQFDLPHTQELSRALKRLYFSELAEPFLASGLDPLLINVLGGRVMNQNLDDRVTRAVGYLQARIGQLPTGLADIAALLNISPSRLQHLFRDELGVGFSRLQSWLRFRQALLDFRLRRSLTHAAHEVGFSSSSHFSNAFRSMFGVSFREALLGSDEIVFRELVWD